MKIRSINFNNRRKAFEVKTYSNVYWFPYALCEIKPSKNDRIIQLFIDDEIGREGFTYVLESGKEGTVHIDQVLEYNKDPSYLRDLLVYKLTLEAQKQMASSSLSTREIIRRLGTSASQFYRILDQSNYNKSVDQVLSLLNVLNCDVDLVVRVKSA